MNVKEMKCMKCGKTVSEQDMRDRYEELAKKGIIAMLIPMCVDCRLEGWEK